MFEQGKTYKTRSICNAECIFSVTIAKRTAKTVKTTSGQSFRIKILNGIETFMMGNYSMAPMFRADRF